MTLEVIKNENSILVTSVNSIARRYGLFRKIRLYIILIALRGNDQCEHYGKNYWSFLQKCKNLIYLNYKYIER